MMHGQAKISRGGQMVPRGRRSHGKGDREGTCLPSRRSHVANTRIHFVQPIKERRFENVGYGLALEGASAAALVKSFQTKGNE